MRRSASSSGAASPNGCAGWARPCRFSVGCSTASARPPAAATAPHAATAAEAVRNARREGRDGAPASPDLTLTLPSAIADAVADGELTASAAFMQGRMKTAGDLGLVLDVLAAVDSRA